MRNTAEDLLIDWIKADEEERQIEVLRRESEALQTLTNGQLMSGRNAYP